MSNYSELSIDQMNEENEHKFEKLQDDILDAFYTSSAVNDTIWLDGWTTLYEQIMMLIGAYDKEV